MRVLIDTNILISAMIWPCSKPYKAFMYAVSMENINLFICQLTIEELREVVSAKFKSKVNTLELFIKSLSSVATIVKVPVKASVQEKKIRDKSDRPIMRAAAFINADYIVTGDKDFLESGIEKPKSITAAEFLSMIGKSN